MVAKKRNNSAAYVVVAISALAALGLLLYFFMWQGGQGTVPNPAVTCAGKLCGTENYTPPYSNICVLVGAPLYPKDDILALQNFTQNPSLSGCTFSLHSTNPQQVTASCQHNIGPTANKSVVFYTNYCIIVS